MIFVECEKIVYENGARIYIKKPVPCPNCNIGIGMWRYGYRKRRMRDYVANKYWIFLPRYKCQKCGKIYWTLPDFLLPYKQYDRSTIEKVQNGCWDGCGASYLSIYFWRRLTLS